jgi:predicted O-methyltransferase YrrM
MSHVTPAPVAAYLAALRPDAHPYLATIAADGHAQGLPIVDPDSGALLHALVRLTGATRVLEIGTAVGYSGLWMASALPPGGMLISLEREPARAAAARAHFAAAGLGQTVSVMAGDATRFLHKVAGPFDLIFQDGDKAQYGPMLDRLVDLLRPGGVLVTDNLLWDGEVVDGYVAEPRHDAASTAALRAHARQLAADARLYTTFVAVGDGLAIAVKRA